MSVSWCAVRGFATYQDRPLLRAEEEVALGHAIEAGVFARERLDAGVDEPRLRRDLTILAAEGRRSFEHFVAANHRLAAYWARRRFYAGAAGTLDVEDLTAEGVLGVVRAVQKWDYRLGCKFSTYASNWIKQFQERAVVRAWPVAMTFAEWEECRQVTRARRALTELYQRTPTTAEIAKECDSTVRRIDELKRLMSAPDSLDRPVTPRAGSHTSKTASLGDLIADRHASEPGEDDDGAECTELAHRLLDGLSARERLVVSDVFGFGADEVLPVEDVALTRGLPVEMVRRMLETALAKMRSLGGDVDAVATMLRNAG